jgi:hypothetical protein
MPPPLSEAWATAYVQILITLVVFALGVPALAIQLVVQDDIREVFHRRMKITGWIASLVITLLAFVAFVWVLHPPFKKVGGASTGRAAGAADGVVVSLPLSVSPPPVTNQGSEARGPVVGVGTPTVSSPNADDDDDGQSFTGSLIASIVMTLIPLVLIGLGMIQATYLRRQHIIKELEKEIVGDYTSEQTLIKRLWHLPAVFRDWFFKKKRGRSRRENRLRRLRTTLRAYVSVIKLGPRRGKERGRALTARKKPGHIQEEGARPLEEEPLSDLIFLGKNGKAGRDKKLVLDSLNRISIIVQSSPTYQGGELADLIKGIKDIILNTEQPGSDEDFNNAIVILKGIRHRLSLRGDVSKYLDAGLGTKMLEDLGVEAVKSKSERTAERLLEEASSSSKTVFRMGLTALDSRNFHTAVLSLNRLESLAGAKNLTACQETFDLIGLIAHFTVTGTATRMRADQFLSKHLQAFIPSIDVCLRGAYEHHYSSSNFDTADKVLDLRQNIKSERWSPLLLTSI